MPSGVRPPSCLRCGSGDRSYSGDPQWQYCVACCFRRLSVAPELFARAIPLSRVLCTADRRKAGAFVNVVSCNQVLVCLVTCTSKRLGSARVSMLRTHANSTWFARSGHTVVYDVAWAIRCSRANSRRFRREVTLSPLQRWPPYMVWFLVFFLFRLHALWLECDAVRRSNKSSSGRFGKPLIVVCLYSARCGSKWPTRSTVGEGAASVADFEIRYAHSWVTDREAQAVLGEGGSRAGRVDNQWGTLTS